MSAPIPAGPAAGQPSRSRATKPFKSPSSSAISLSSDLPPTDGYFNQIHSQPQNLIMDPSLALRRSLKEREAVFGSREPADAIRRSTSSPVSSTYSPRSPSVVSEVSSNSPPASRPVSRDSNHGPHNTPLPPLPREFTPLSSPLPRPPTYSTAAAESTYQLVFSEGTQRQVQAQAREEQHQPHPQEQPAGYRTMASEDYFLPSARNQSMTGQTEPLLRRIDVEGGRKKKKRGCKHWFRKNRKWLFCSGFLFFSLVLVLGLGLGGITTLPGNGARKPIPVPVRHIIQICLG